MIYGENTSSVVNFTQDYDPDSDVSELASENLKGSLANVSPPLLDSQKDSASSADEASKSKNLVSEEEK